MVVVGATVVVVVGATVVVVEGMVAKTSTPTYTLARATPPPDHVWPDAVCQEPIPTAL